MSRLFGRKEKSAGGDEFHELTGFIITGASLVAFVGEEFRQDGRETIISIVGATTGSRLPAEQLLMNVEGIA